MYFCHCLPMLRHAAALNGCVVHLLGCEQHRPHTAQHDCLETKEKKTKQLSAALTRPRWPSCIQLENIPIQPFQNINSSHPTSAMIKITVFNSYCHRLFFFYRISVDRTWDRGPISRLSISGTCTHLQSSDRDKCLQRFWRICNVLSALKFPIWYLSYDKEQILSHH